MTQSSPFTRAETSKQRADDLIAWLRDYAENHINSRLIDERRTIPPYVVLDFGNRGILGIHVDPTEGGAGLNHLASEVYSANGFVTTPTEPIISR